MNICLRKRKFAGMTVIEVLVVVAVLLLLAAALCVPALRKAKARSSKMSCLNDLSQVGIAFRIWAGDNADKYPMQVSVARGGTMELVSSGTVFRHFEVMANELSTPKILLCPEDKDPLRLQAIVFGRTITTPPPQTGFTGDSNTSYFVGVDATPLGNSTPLSGDRNITLAGAALNPGLHALPTNAPVGWSEKIHVRKGNILLSDGSVQGVSSAALPHVFQTSGIATNRLAVP